ncbi:MAG: ABC transporter substrate-binding protein, partial [Alphaproteobacteria bacterium]
MKRILMSAVMAVSLGAAASAQQGVSDTEILLGSHTAMSGPLAPWGQASMGSAQAYFGAVNAAGGIHGRQLVVNIEDHGYEVAKAAAAGEKLVIDDGVFAIFGALGTPMNNAVMPLQEEFGVPNVFPLSAARSMEGDMAFQGLSSYYEQIQKGTQHFVENMGVSAPCIIYLETDFGRESLDALNDVAASLGVEVKATAAHQPRDTDYVGSLLRLQRDGCDFIALGTNFPEAIAIKATAAQLGYNVPIMGSTAIFED